MENCHENEEPPSVSNSEGSCSSERYCGIDIRDLYRVSFRSAGNIQSLAIHGLARLVSLHNHKVVDLGHGADG